MHCADFIFVLERVNVLGREGDCEWLAEAAKTGSPWRLTCVKNRVGDTTKHKTSQITDELATVLHAMADYCGFKVPHKDIWVLCLTGTKLFLELIRKTAPPPGIAAAPEVTQTEDSRAMLGRKCRRCGERIVFCSCGR